MSSSTNATPTNSTLPSSSSAASRLSCSGVCGVDQKWCGWRRGFTVTCQRIRRIDGSMALNFWSTLNFPTGTQNSNFRIPYKNWRICVCILYSQGIRSHLFLYHCCGKFHSKVTRSCSRKAWIRIRNQNLARSGSRMNFLVNADPKQR